MSGAHVDGLRMVGAGQADVAAIDCVTYALLQQYRPAALHRVRIVPTASAPAHPYVTPASMDAEQRQRLQEGLQAAFADARLFGVREDLMLRGALFFSLRMFMRRLPASFLF
ncbi:MAG: hypothetical protein R3E95_07615 [Thiolinea sp.]